MNINVTKINKAKKRNYNEHKSIYVIHMINILFAL